MHDILQAILNNVALTDTQRNLIIEQFNTTQKLQEGGLLPYSGAFKNSTYLRFPTYNQFLLYLKSTPPNDRSGDQDYDLSALYLDPDLFAEWWSREQQNPGYAHFDGRFKKENHITYPGKHGENWRQENGEWHYYVPEDHREGGQYGHTYDEYVNYWNENEPESILHYDDRVYRRADGGDLKAPDKVKITIGDKSYTVELADTEEELKQGLMNRKSLADDAGMLFDFNEEGTHEMWMKNTLIPLTLIFLNEDLEVIKVVDREPNDEKLIGCPGTWYVLEVNPGSGIKVGDELDFEDKEDEEYVMKVLAPDGSVLMQLKGGERIVSRKQTKVLIKKAKRAKKAKTNGAYASLGKYMFKVLDGQDNRDPEYVNAPD